MLLHVTVQRVVKIKDALKSRLSHCLEKRSAPFLELRFLGVSWEAVIY